MRRDLVSRVKHIQMGPNSRLSTCVDEKIAPSKVVTDMVPATMSLMPKSKQKEMFSFRNRIVVYQCVFIRMLMYLLLIMWGPHIGCLGF